MLAAGKPIGKSLAEPELVGEAKAHHGKIDAGKVPIPTDVVCAKEFAAECRRRR